MNNKHKGSLAELKACAWLIEQGYEVFRNVSQHGPVDLIATKDEEILKIDVKTMQERMLKYGLPSSKRQSDLKILVYVPELGTCQLF